MKKALLLACALMYMLALSVCRAHAQPPSDSIAAPLRERIVRETRSLIDKRFAHFAGIPGFDFEAEFARYREQALATSSRWDFSLLTRAFIASLQNGHTTYGDSWMRDADSASLPFALSYIEGRWLVTTTRHPDLHVGDVVISIDGVAVERVYASHARYISASNDRARRREFTSRGFLWPRRITLELEQRGRVTAERSSVSSMATAVPVVRDRWIEQDRIAYVAIGSFGDPAHESRALTLVKGTYRRAPVLIVDVRGNGGGNTPRDLIKTLLNGKEFVWWKEDPYLLPNATFDRIGAAMKRRGRADTPYVGRVIVLANGSCGSACEDFLMPLQWQRQATVIGDTTAGTTGQPVFLRFDNGIQITVSAKRAYFPDGSSFEGVGIAPDIRVPMTRQQLIDGTDAAMVAALDAARRMMASPSPDLP